MKRYTWIVLSRCSPGQEAAFERWYDSIHIPDLLRVPGIVAARRGHVADAQTIMAKGGLRLARAPADAYPFVAFYAFETDDPESVLAEVIARAGTPRMPLSEHLGDVHTMLYEDC